MSEFNPQATFADLIAAKPPTGEHQINLDPDLADEYQELKDDLSVEERVDPDSPRVAELRARVAELEPQVQATTRVIKLKGLPRKEFQALKEAFPLDDEARLAQLQKTGVNANVELAGFMPALFSACSTAPLLSVAEAEQALDAWPEVQVVELFWKCMGLCSRRSVEALGKASARTPS